MIISAISLDDDFNLEIIIDIRQEKW